MPEQQFLEPEIQALDQLAESQGARALPDSRDAVAVLRTADAPWPLAWALAIHARVLAWADHFDEAEAAAREALEWFGPADSLRGQAQALHALGLANFRRGVPSRALEFTGQAMLKARQAADAVLQVRMSSTLRAIFSDMGRLADAVNVLEEGLRAADGTPDEPVVLRLRNNLGLSLARWALRDFDERAPGQPWQARAERALDVIGPALAAWRVSGDPVRIGSTLENVAIAELVLGRIDVAAATLDEAERLIPQEAAYPFVYFACVRARVHLARGEPGLALETIERGQASAERRGGHAYMDELWRLAALAHEARGEFARALVAYRRFHELRTSLVLAHAEQQASALAVALETERAFSQVSAERERAALAHREARHDALTGLANRRRFDEFLAGLLPRATRQHPVSLVLIDLDHFKRINDLHRHSVGDAALRWVAGHLQAQCRQTDLPARVGGDEFALVMVAPLEVAHQVSNRLRVAVAQACPELPQGLTVRLSAGIAEVSSPCDIHHLYTRAHDALYPAKAAGRDSVRHDLSEDLS